MQRKKTNIWPYLLITPAVLIIIAVVLSPALNAALMSFQSYDLRRSSDTGFIGLTNYIDVLQDKLFWASLWRTILWVVFGVGFRFVFGFILVNLSNKGFYGRGVVRAVSLTPWVTPGVLIGLMWRWIYDGSYGVLNDLLMRVGLISAPVPFLAQESMIMPSVILTIIWRGIPFFALMLLAGLQGVPDELYEAVDIDGVTGLQKLFHITIPAIKNAIFVTTLLRIIWVANSVGVIFNMTGGGPAYTSQTLSVYVFNKANALNLGYSSTMSLLLTLPLLLMTIPHLKSMFVNQETQCYAA